MPVLFGTGVQKGPRHRQFSWTAQGECTRLCFVASLCYSSAFPVQFIGKQHKQYHRHLQETWHGRPLNAQQQLLGNQELLLLLPQGGVKPLDANYQPTQYPQKSPKALKPKSLERPPSLRFPARAASRGSTTCGPFSPRASPARGSRPGSRRRPAGFPGAQARHRGAASVTNHCISHPAASTRGDARPTPPKR